MKLDTFTTAYIECALWSSTDESTESGGYPLDKNYSLRDIDADTLTAMVADCAKFQSDNWDDIAEDVKLAGYDFWLSRNGHGAGFFDGDWDEVGDKLQAIAAAYGEFNLYVGDDNQIYGYGG